MYTGTPPTNPATVTVVPKVIERNSRLQFTCDFTPDPDTDIKYYVVWYKNETEIKAFNDVAKPDEAAIDNSLIKKAGSQVIYLFSE